MDLRFTGTFEQLARQLQPVAQDGNWLDACGDQKQFQHNNGSVLTWNPSTGMIQFQGNQAERSNFEVKVRGLLSEIDRPLASPPVATADIACPATPNAEGIAVEWSGVGSPESCHWPVVCSTSSDHFLGRKFSDSELIIGLVGAVGTELKQVIDILVERLPVFRYTAEQVRVSSDIIQRLVDTVPTSVEGTTSEGEYHRIKGMMDVGNDDRKRAKDNSVLALGVAARIASNRPRDEPNGGPKLRERHAYIVNSLKHPDEVARLREIYPEAFYLIGVHADEKRRRSNLVENKRISESHAVELMERDEDEHLPYGQRTSDTFHLSDFFVRIDENQDRLRNSVWRVLSLLFGDPSLTPTFDEYAMFMAFSAALRSADLSRQVGAVIATHQEIIATGANDCPKYGGGLYWPEYDTRKSEIRDVDGGRDYTRGEDANKVEQRRIIDDIVARVGDAADATRLREALGASRIGDITEYGRMVHAEMESLMSCARSQVSARGATLYCTTFPCHNCAKHIVAAGIKRVVFVEPYPKSKAAEFHDDSISLGFSDDDDKVHLEPFVGVGPRRFFDLFSMRLGSGYPLSRKDAEGCPLKWRPEEGKLRIQMLPCSYIELELVASDLFNKLRERKETENGR